MVHTYFTCKKENICSIFQTWSVLIKAIFAVNTEFDFSTRKYKKKDFKEGRKVNETNSKLEVVWTTVIQFFLLLIFYVHVLAFKSAFIFVTMSMLQT